LFPDANGPEFFVCNYFFGMILSDKFPWKKMQIANEAFHFNQ
jgi:hypothetical protein